MHAAQRRKTRIHPANQPSGLHNNSSCEETGRCRERDVGKRTVSTEGTWVKGPVPRQARRGKGPFLRKVSKEADRRSGNLKSFSIASIRQPYTLRGFGHRGVEKKRLSAGRFLKGFNLPFPELNSRFQIGNIRGRPFSVRTGYGAVIEMAERETDRPGIGAE